MPCRGDKIMTKDVKWPSIRIAATDKGVIDAIRSHNGRLKNINSKDLLLIAAALAVKNNVPYDEGLKKSKMSDTISYANLNGSGYREYRHYISAIFFATKAKKDVENMKDVNDMVRNFEDYAHRGILYLKDKYLDTKDGDSELFKNFVLLLKDSSQSAV